MPSAHEHFSEQFQKWEIRGRGWQVYEHPVPPEPPFVPFRFKPMRAVDNGVRPSFLGSLFNKLLVPPTPPVEAPEEEESPLPLALLRESQVEFQAALSDNLKVSHEAFAQFLLNLPLCQEPIAFELLGTHQRVRAQFAASEFDASLVRKQLAAHFPDVPFREQMDSLKRAWSNSVGREAFALEFGLEREFYFPLATGNIDPFVSLIGALSQLQPGEMALFQVLFQPVHADWAESISRTMYGANDQPVFVNAPELTAAAENKVAQPLYAAVVRIMGRTDTIFRAHELARDLASAMRVFTSPKGNRLIPLHNDDYPYLDHLNDVLCRQSRRSGMILNSDELIGFVHLPDETVLTPELLRDAGLTRAAPDIVQSSPGVVIGDNEHNGETVSVFLTPDQRVRHTHIIGVSGSGKSSLLLNLILQDIENGDGVAVLDPHGDLIDQILGMIPADRIDDVVLVDPSDVDFPIGFNILQAHSEEEKNLLASDLVAVFQRLSTSWGDQMDTVLQNAILAVLESSRGGTLADLRRFLLEKPFRTEFLQTVNDPELIYYWQEVFPQLSGNKSIGSVLTRLQDFFSRKPLRNMVSQRDNKLDFADIMDSGKIFLARLPEGCGEENSFLLGTLLVAKFQQTAMARHSQLAANRKDFWLYIDEFDHFISPSMAKILKGARKYRLGLTLAHQELHQLQSDPKVASAVMTHPCTRIVFRIGDDDAKKLGDGFIHFEAKSLKTLAKFNALVRVERDDFDFNLALRKPDLSDHSEEWKAEVIAASRAKYATPRAEVEAMLLANIRPAAKKPKPPEPPDDGIPTAPKPAAPSSLPTAITQPTEIPAMKPQMPMIETALPPVAELPHVAEVPAITPPPAVEVPKTTSDGGRPQGPRSEKESATSPRDLGRGGARHKSIQSRLKEEAQKLGFHAEVEKQLASGSNDAADLVLRRGSVEMALEITITTSVDHEFGNVKKCLAAGFSRVAVIATRRKHLDEIAAAVQGGLGSEAAAKVAYQTPDEFLAELHKLAKASEEPPPSEPLAKTGKILGFEINRNFPKLSPEEQRANQQAIHAVALKAMKS